MPNCRSGLQSNTKEVEDLAGKDAPDNSGRKLSILKFPLYEIMAIPRESDHCATYYNGVCELHFQKEDFFKMSNVNSGFPTQPYVSDRRRRQHQYRSPPQHVMRSPTGSCGRLQPVPFEMHLSVPCLI